MHEEIAAAHDRVGGACLRRCMVAQGVDGCRVARNEWGYGNCEACGV